MLKACQIDCIGRKVAQVVSNHLWQFDVFQWIHIEPFLRHIHWHMRSIEANPQVERLIMRLFELSNTPGSNLVVRHLFIVIALRIDTPIPKPGRTGVGIQFLLGGRTLAAKGTLVVRVILSVLATVKKLARTCDIITVFLKALRHCRDL